MTDDRPTLVLVGAGTAAIDVLIRLLPLRAAMWGDVRLVDTGAAVGRQITVNGEPVTVQEISDEAFVGADIAVFNVAESLADQWVPRIAETGVGCIDSSRRYRRHRTVPMVAPGINMEAARGHSIIALPSATALLMADALDALHRTWGLRQLVVSTYLSASGVGHAGTSRLYDEIEALGGDRSMGQLTGNVRYALQADLSQTSPFSDPLAFNVVPFADSVDKDGWSRVEASVRSDLRSILDEPELRVAVTAVRVPVIRAHSMTVHATFERPIERDDAVAAFMEAPSIVLLDNPDAQEWPTPVDVVGSDPTFIGRLRQTIDFPNTIDFFLCGDNLRAGAALPMLQAAEGVAQQLAENG